MQKATSLNYVAIIYVKGNAYRIHFYYMSKNDEIRIMGNFNLIPKKECFMIFFIMCKKWVIQIIIKDTKQSKGLLLKWSKNVKKSKQEISTEIY